MINKNENNNIFAHFATDKYNMKKFNKFADFIIVMNMK